MNINQWINLRKDVKIMKSEETYLACKKKKYRDKCCSKLRILKMMDVSNENKERRERESVI